jgi:hypothetical protein
MPVWLQSTSTFSRCPSSTSRQLCQATMPSLLL